MKVGDYARTTSGIERLKKENDNGWFFEKNMIIKPDNIEKYIIKSSPNIIDLIEVGDIIREKDNHLFEVYAVGSDCVYINNLEEFILIKDIKGIVTKEQFSQMEYRIGE